MEMVRRTRAPSLGRFALSFVPLALVIALDRVVHVGWLGWVIILGASFPGAWRDLSRKQAIMMSPAGLKLDDEFIPRASLANALSVTENDQTWLRVERRDDTAIEIAVVSPSSAHETVRVLELDDTKTALEVRLTRPRATGAYGGLLILATVVSMYFGALYMRGHIGTVFFALLFIGLAASIADAQARRVTVVAGIDGISITDRRGDTQFISWADIDSIGADGHHVRLRRKDGAPLELDALVGHRRRTASGRAVAIATRLESLRRAFAEAPEPAKVGGLGQGAFRQSHMPRDVLWDTLRNARTRVSDRVVAAAALRQNGEPEDLTRLRVAVDRCASPARERVRAVLDADDERLESVVDEMARVSS